MILALLVMVIQTTGINVGPGGHVEIHDSTITGYEVPVKCPPGQRFHAEMATTDLIIKGGCYTPEQWAHAEEEFGKSICFETSWSIGYWGGPTDISCSEWENHDWVNHRCVSTHTWQVLQWHHWRKVGEKTYHKLCDQKTKP